MFLRRQGAVIADRRAIRCVFRRDPGDSLRTQRRTGTDRLPHQSAQPGVPCVLLAAFIVKSLPLGAVRWLVIAVVVYTALAMLRSAFEKPSPASTLTLAPPPPSPPVAR